MNNDNNTSNTNIHAINHDVPHRLGHGFDFGTFCDLIEASDTRCR